MSPSPPVTWLLPVRNGMPYLPLTLASLAEQTYGNHRIIAWDNGSSDGTLEILHEWIPKRLTGTVIKGKPLRLGPTMAALVEMAETELCAVIHSDDLCLPQRLELQTAFMQEHPEVGLLGTQIELIDENGTIKHDEEGWSYPAEDAEIRWRSRWHTQFCHPSVMIRRSAVLAAGNYRDAQPYEDAELAVRLARIAEMRNLPDVLLRYRRTTTSSTGNVNEFLPLDREAARLNASILFSGTPNPRAAMELWEATHPFYAVSTSKFSYIYRLKKAAVLLAKQIGKPETYFINTATFQRQQDSLKKRFYQRVGLMPLARLSARLRGAPMQN